MELYWNLTWYYIAIIDVSFLLLNIDNSFAKLVSIKSCNSLDKDVNGVDDWFHLTGLSRLLLFISPYTRVTKSACSLFNFLTFNLTGVAAALERS